ncbi:hypothetical protein Tco_1305401 [Tanacetum coccineum]
MSNLESNDEAVDTRLVFPFPHSDNDSDDLYAMTGRKSYLLKDKQIPSVGVLNRSFLGIQHLEGIQREKTRDLGSFGEETDKTTDLHQHLSRISTQKLETASQIRRDAVTNPTMTGSQDFTMASARTTQPDI